VFTVLYAFVKERDRAFGAIQRLFGQYLSPEIARSLLADPGRAALGGENRDVSALFADLEGFTPFTESRPPQETVVALNRYFSAVVPVIFANGGTIIQFAGDAIVAVWNAPSNNRVMPSPPRARRLPCNARSRKSCAWTRRSRASASASPPVPPW